MGVWLNAADSLVTATIMPSVGAELGGYGYFSWATAGFLIGAILSGASAGRLSEVFGLRSATAFAGLVLALGCVTSASAPNIGVFLAGRLVQGVGSGWISGFAMVAIALLFPERHLVRVFASVTGIWGIATILGPLVGGLFAESGDWRGVFWLFAAQGVVFSVIAMWLLTGAHRAAGGPGVPWAQLGLLGLGVGAIAMANVVRSALHSLLLVAVGFLFLALVVRADARARNRLLPHRAGDIRTLCGSAYASMFALTAAAIGFLVYAPVILQQLRGLTPLWAGYVVGAQALTWTLTAFAVANAPASREDVWIRRGAICVLLGLVVLTMVMRDAPLVWVIVGAALMGAGFGFCSSLMNRRVMTALADEDRAIGSAALIAVRQTGGAAGAAIAGVAANLVGLSSGLTVATAEAAAVWVFASAIPLALAGTWAAFRLTGRAVRARKG